MLRISLQRFAQNDGAIKNKQRGPASFPVGPFVKLPELSGHCHAASARTAGAATAAACLAGRDRRPPRDPRVQAPHDHQRRSTLRRRDLRPRGLIALHSIHGTSHGCTRRGAAWSLVVRRRHGGGRGDAAARVAIAHLCGSRLISGPTRTRCHPNFGRRLRDVLRRSIALSGRRWRFGRLLDHSGRRGRLIGRM